MSQQWTPPAASTPGGQPPPNYLVPAILVTLFCCLPGGIASIIFATQVNSKHQAGDLVGAQEASKKAKMFMMISAGVGVLVWIIVIIINIGALATNM